MFLKNCSYHNISARPCPASWEDDRTPGLQRFSDFLFFLLIGAKNFKFHFSVTFPSEPGSFFLLGSDMASLSPLPDFTAILCGGMKNVSKASASGSECLIRISRGPLAITDHQPEVASERWLSRPYYGLSHGSDRAGCASADYSLPSSPAWCAAILPSSLHRASGRAGGEKEGR